MRKIFHRGYERVEMPEIGQVKVAAVVQQQTGNLQVAAFERLQECAFSIGIPRVGVELRMGQANFDRMKMMPGDGQMHNGIAPAIDC
ncbi:hypothetical protein SDC9_98236 [bioreactor metagenome]|uniref:Uncharacterized protein n=1 Tax=bioreactor metagenome TaxID=1076179 RepID=A0A645AEN3_9ZZZZ